MFFNINKIYQLLQGTTKYAAYFMKVEASYRQTRKRLSERARTTREVFEKKSEVGKKGKRGDLGWSQSFSRSG